MAEQTMTIKGFMSKLYRHPLLQDIPLETVVDYMVDFMRIVGCPNIFTEKTESLKVKDYRAQLPCDYYQMIQVRACQGEVFRYTTDSFHMSPNKENSADLTYKVQGNFIYTSIKEGTIEIAYQAIDTDEDGFPLLPDNSSFTRALEAFIKKNWFTILFDMGKITQQSLQLAQQDYAWAVGDCQSEFSRLTIDKAESFFNSWRTLILRDTEHNRGFINNGSKEYLRRH